MTQLEDQTVNSTAIATSTRMGHYRGKRGRQSEKGALRSLSRWASLTGSVAVSGTIHHFPELAEAKVIGHKYCVELSCGPSMIEQMETKRLMSSLSSQWRLLGGLLEGFF